MRGVVLHYPQNQDTFYLFKKNHPILGNELGLYVAVRTRRVLQYCTAAHSTIQAKGLTNLAWHIQIDWNELKQHGNCQTHNFHPNSKKYIQTRKPPGKKCKSRPQLKEITHHGGKLMRHHPGQKLPLGAKKVGLNPIIVLSQIGREWKLSQAGILWWQKKRKQAWDVQNVINLSHPHLKFKCLPQFPAELENNPSLQTVINRKRKILLHEETMDCIIGNRNCKTNKYICNDH